MISLHMTSLVRDLLTIQWPAATQITDASALIAAVESLLLQFSWVRLAVRKHTNLQINATRLPPGLQRQAFRTALGSL